MDQCEVMFLKLIRRTNLRGQISMTVVKANYSLFINLVEVKQRQRVMTSLMLLTVLTEMVQL